MPWFTHIIFRARERFIHLFHNEERPQAKIKLVILVHFPNRKGAFLGASSAADRYHCAHMAMRHFGQNEPYAAMGRGWVFIPSYLHCKTRHAINQRGVVSSLRWLWYRRNMIWHMREVVKGEMQFQIQRSAFSEIPAGGVLLFDRNQYMAFRPTNDSVLSQPARVVSSSSKGKMCWKSVSWHYHSCCDIACTARQAARRSAGVFAARCVDYRAILQRATRSAPFPSLNTRRKSSLSRYGFTGTLGGGSI